MHHSTPIHSIQALARTLNLGPQTIPIKAAALIRWCAGALPPPVTHAGHGVVGIPTPARDTRRINKKVNRTGMRGHRSMWSISTDVLHLYHHSARK